MKHEIVHMALQALRAIAGIEASFKPQKTLDGSLKMGLNGHTYGFTIAVKQELRAYQLPQIEDYFVKHKNFMLVASMISSSIKQVLRDKGIPYVEANGNVFLKKENLFVFVDTQKPLNIPKAKGNRAFTKTGLKVVFYLLQHKDAIQLPQRELANLTGVALGNIPQVINGLKETGYLISLNPKDYIWENRKGLLDRWIVEYATLLRPKLVKDRYTLKAKWDELGLDHRKTVWGGEPAADILTRYLRPEKLVMYTTESRMDLMRNYKLIPDRHGAVEVLDLFWKHTNERTAPALLVYADLMLTGDKRNEETAQKIYHEYIASNL